MRAVQVKEYVKVCVTGKLRQAGGEGGGGEGGEATLTQEE